jgi:class 3 adenylate cyclase
MALIGNSGLRSTAALLQDELIVPKRKTLRLDTFPRGMDNAHIDVRLDPALNSAIDTLVTSAMVRRLRDLKLLDGSNPLSEDLDAVDRFREAFVPLSLSVAQQARQSSRREVYQLFVLAVIKQIYLSVDRSLQEYRDGFDEAPLLGALTTTETVSRHEKLWRFGRHQAVLRYEVSREAVKLVHSLELVGRKQRKSILALSWPVAEDMLFNPLLQLGKLDEEATFMDAYPFLLIKPEIFRRFETVVLDVLCHWLPDCPVRRLSTTPESDLNELQLRRDEGEFPGYAQVESYLRAVMSDTEYQRGETNWLDDPGNLAWLMGGDGERGVPGFWDKNRWREFQKNLLQELEKTFSKSGLLEMVFASALLPELYRDLGRKGSLRLLFEFLTGGRSRKELLPILQQFKEISDLELYMDRMESAYKRLGQAGKSRRREWLTQVVEGYAGLRRDLKLSWEMYRAMDLIRLPSRPDELELSRANRLLQEFHLGSQAQKSEILGHVIIKADLRGSTELTASMLREGLNPASYFSQNLFDPINTLLEKYGAEKVFVEGDAVILMLLEYASPPSPVVARACALAYDIIDEVLGRNAENHHMGLPELELGIGISYVNEAPCYLFDAGRKITISPAINLADRLSSCTHRDLSLFGRVAVQGVEVIQHLKSANNVSGDAEYCRYNVNGIELDSAAFEHLNTELVLRKVKAKSLGKKDGDRYYVGRFPDAAGKTRWQVLRQSRIKIWDGKKLQPVKKSGRSFYEVVTVPEILNRTREKLSGR